MKAIRILALVVLVTSAVTYEAAQAMDHPKKMERPARTEHPAHTEHSIDAITLITVANGAGNFKTFLAAIEAAGLTEKFQSKGPYTVFAPTDEAFAKLPKGTLEDLLKPANKAQLAGILACHVVPGKIMAADVKTMKATNVNGEDLVITVSNDVVMVNDAKVIQADLGASNGVIHAIDMVIVPAAPPEHPASDQPKDHPAH